MPAAVPRRRRDPMSFSGRRQRRTAGAEAGVGMLFWLTMLMLGGFALGCIALGLVRPEVVEDENRLQADRTIPNPNLEEIADPSPLPGMVTAEPERSASATQLPSAEPPVSQTELPPVITESPALPIVDPALILQRLEMPYAVEAVEPLRVVTTAAVQHDVIAEPEIFLIRREPTLGDSPMIRTFKTLALASLLAASTPTFATAGDDLKSLKESIEALKKTVEGLAPKVEKASQAMSGKEVLAEINRLEKSLVEKLDKASNDLSAEINSVKAEQLQQKLDLQNLRSLPKRVQVLEEDLKKLRKQIPSEIPIPTGSIDRAALDEVRSRLSAIEKSLEGLQQAPGISGERKSFSPPVGNPLGRVLLTNMYSVPALFIVNGQNYRVEPGMTTQLDGMQPGALVYEVAADGWGLIRGRTATAVEANKTLTITVR